MKPDRYLVLLCSERSGSNLLKGILNRSPQVYVCPPLPVFDVMHPLIDSYGDVRDDAVWNEIVSDSADLLSVNHQPLPVTIGAAALFSETRDGARATGDLVRASMSLMAEDKGAVVAGYKFSIHFELLAPFLETVPVTHLVHLVRDPRDVLLSKMKSGFESVGFEEMAEHWAEQQERASGIAATDAMAVEQIRYEDLVATPADVLGRLSSFLGIDSIEDGLDFYKDEANVDAAGRTHMWENLARPLMTGNTQKFYAEWNATDVGRIEEICGDTMRRFGYEPCDPSRFEHDDKRPSPRSLAEKDHDYYRDQSVLMTALAEKAQHRREAATAEPTMVTTDPPTADEAADPAALATLRRMYERMREMLRS
jgi:hypothetical protein